MHSQRKTQLSPLVQQRQLGRFRISFEKIYLETEIAQEIFKRIIIVEATPKHFEGYVEYVGYCGKFIPLNEGYPPNEYDIEYDTEKKQIIINPKNDNILEIG